MSTLGSANRAERLSAVCRLINKRRLESELTDAKVALEVGVSEVQYRRFLDEHTARHFSLADLFALERQFGGVLSAFAAELGYRLVPTDVPTEKRSVCEAASVTLRSSSEACADVLDAVADGVITARERASLRMRIDEARRAMAALEASLEGTGVA